MGQLYLTSAGLEFSKVGVVGLESIVEFVHGFIHPLDQSVVIDVVQSLEVVEVDLLKELGNKDTTGGLNSVSV